ncbi:MAG: DUF1571 domain-containing protein [Cytophagaceae bacterium]
MKKLQLVFICSFLLISTHGFSQSELTVDEISEKMVNSISHITTLKYGFKSTERIGKTYVKSYQEVKYAKNPLRFYLYSHFQDKGAEVLFNPIYSKDKVYVNPNGFPYYSLYLDPLGSILRKGKHHTLYELGFDYFAGLLFNLKQKSEAYKNIKCTGTVNWNNTTCYKMELQVTDYKILVYTVNEGETLTSIAEKFFVNDYRIMELNNLASYTSIKAGQKIKVPNHYCKYFIVYVDKKTFLPVMQEMHDEEGMYERYEFIDVKMNEKLEDKEFDKGNPAYKF